MSKLLDAIEAVGEAAQAAGIEYAAIRINVGTDADVDRIHGMLGTRQPVGQFDHAPSYIVYEGRAWRSAETTIAGVRVTVSSTHRQLDAIGALDLDVAA